MSEIKKNSRFIVFFFLLVNIALNYCSYSNLHTKLEGISSSFTDFNTKLRDLNCEIKKKKSK
jgi:hypothetical protein